ncbi:uncharacterized protein LOC132854210 [Tachysurus vachellii]|uniref:uncharacterized protein LOC132854210 n=1 Tax=Tachysurus vachellii TaxID=175792 RepID=UPI00296B01B9|nr:uncharacterized protein LOC132854210 [Tachysurus vachellii]
MLLEFAGVLHLIFQIHAQVSPYQTTWTVTCDDENICTPETSHVFIKCSYTHTNIHTVIWFSPKQKEKWKNEYYPEDLTLDSDLAGRVNHTETLNSSTLTIRDVTLRDSGEYRFILVTANREKYLSSKAVTLKVTDLQVWMHPGITEQELHLTCGTQCRLAANWDTWWKDGKRISSKFNSEPLVLSAGDGGSYFCSIISKAVMIHSPAVCVWKKNCWNVTYAQRTVCAFKGSSVSFPCTYSYPSGQKVNKSYWTFNQNDVSLLEQFAGRVEFVRDKENDCTLRLTNLKDSDSGDYRFLFTTHTTEPVFSSSLRVQLIITDFQVRVSSSSTSEGQTVTLSCITKCTLPKHTISWYKNSQCVMNKLTKYNNLYLNASSYKDTDTYTCAVRDTANQNCTAASIGDRWWIQFAIWAAGVFMAVLTLLIVIQLIRRARQKKNDTQSVSNPVDDTYTGLDPTAMSLTYATLGDIEVSLTDTYTALSLANQSSEYNTLFAYSRMTSRTERYTHTQVVKVSDSKVQREASDSAYENVECNVNVELRTGPHSIHKSNQMK